MALAREPEKSPLFDRVDSCIRGLQDVRQKYRYKITRSPATRQAAMAGLVDELEAGHLPLEELDIRCLAIFALSGTSIKKGTPTEARLACRAITLLLLTLRDGSPGPLLDAAFPVLSKAIETTHEASTLIALIDGLAVSCFAGARREEEAMEAIWHVVDVAPAARSRSAKVKTSTTVVVAAVFAWTFLLTTVVVPATTNTHRKRAGRSAAAIASLVEMLDADDRRIRMAVGEALAVCVELNLVTGKDTDALAAKVSDLAAEPARKGADNSLLREQKELFGRIAALLDNGEPLAAATSCCLERNGTMEVSTPVRVQLNFLSRFLGSGFLRHVQRNPVLKEAYRFGRVEGKPLSILQKERTIDDCLRDLKKRGYFPGPWVYYNISVVEITKRWPQKLLQLGWN